MSTRQSDALVRLQRVARHPMFGLVIAVIGIVVLVAGGRGEWMEARASLGAANLGLVVVAGIAFGAGTFMLAMAATYALSGRERMLYGSMASQALKYIPGSVWQTSFVFAEASISGVATFAGVTFFTAAVALGVSGILVLQLVGLAFASALLAVAVRRLGTRRTAVVGGMAVGSAAFIVASGVAVSASVGASINLGFDIGTSWAIGVMAIPVPAGLGVREGVMTVVADDAAAVVLAVSALHRVATTAADALVGGAGILLWRRSRRMAP